MKRFLILVLSVVLVAPALAAEISTYYLKGYNSYTQPTAVVIDSIGGGNVARYFKSKWFPIKGASYVVIKMYSTTSGITDSLTRVQFANFDTSFATPDSLAAADAPTPGIANANRGVWFRGNPSSGPLGFREGVLRQFHILPSDTVASKPFIPVTWARILVLSRTNGDNSALATIDSVRVKAEVYYDNKTSTGRASPVE